MSSPASFSKAVVMAGEGVRSPMYTDTLVRLPEDKCPNYALSCVSKKYDDCCVPSKGCLTFAQQWIPSNKNEHFHIHGLWPGNCPGDFTSQEFCDYSPKYRNVEGIVNGNLHLRSQMLEFMPPVKPATNEDHWGHQWRKHGTCLSTVRMKCHEDKDPGQEAVRYFNTNLKLYHAYDIYRELEGNGIVPRSEPYTKLEFLAGLVKWSNIISLYCYNEKLKEIRFSLLGKARNTFLSRPDLYRGNCTNTIYYQLKTSSRRNTPNLKKEMKNEQGGGDDDGWTTVKRKGKFVHDELR